MDSMELVELLRYLGRPTSVGEVRRLLGHDCVSGEMNLREFLRRMRIIREQELETAHKTFAVFKDKETGCISSQELPLVMTGFGSVPRTQIRKEALEKIGSPA